jgi:hypothetical protein
MTAAQWFAAAGMPLLLVVLGLVAMKLNEWDLNRKRRDRLHPGE